MIPGISEISKMDQPTDSPEVSFSAAIRNKLDIAHFLKDQITAPEETIRNMEKKPIVHEEQKASPAVKNDDFRTPGTNSTAQQDSSSSCFMSGGSEILKSINENGVSVCGIANTLERALDFSVYHTTNWVAQRPHKLSRTQKANVVSGITSNESPIPPRGFVAFEPGSSSSCNAAHLSPFESSLDNSYPKMEIIVGNAGSLIGLSRWEESGTIENKLKEKDDDAVGDTLDSDYKAGAFKRESSDIMQDQGMIVSKLRDVYPGKEKIESLPSTDPTQGTRHSSSRVKRFSPPKKRKYMASVLTGHQLNDKLSDNTGKLDDYKELLVAACSVHSANETACSSPFWKEMERIFASVTSQDLLFLKQLLDRAEELNQSQSHMFADACDVAGFTMKSTEVSNLHQRAVKPIAFGRLDTLKTLNVASPLFRRVLSAMIDEDEGKDLCRENEGRRRFFKCMSDDSIFSSCSHKPYFPNNMERVESEVEREVYLQSQKHFLVDGLSSNRSAASNTNSKQNVLNTFGNHEQGQADNGFSHSSVGTCHGNEQKNPTLVQPSQVTLPPIFPFNYQYQNLSLDDKLKLELQSVALDPEMMSPLDGEEFIGREIKGLQGKLYQQAAKVKNNLKKVEKAIECEQELEKRNIEESAMDRLVEMAYKRMCGRPRKSSRTRKISKQVALAFVKRTLSRCKQFEGSGRSCFSHPSLQDIIFHKPPSEDVKPIDKNCLTIVNKEVPKKAKHKGSANIPVLGATQRLDSQSHHLHRVSSGLQQTLSPSSELLSSPIFTLSELKKELLNQIVGSASSKATEVTRINNAGQMLGGFSGSEKPLSRPCGLMSRYDFMCTNEKMKFLGDSGSCSSSEAKFTSRQGGVVSETGIEIRDQERDVMGRNSASGRVHKSKAKPKKKRLLSRIGLQEMARSTQMLELKSSDQIANANYKQFLSPANDSPDAPKDTGSVKIAQLDVVDPLPLDVFNSLAELDDLSSLLNFDEEGLLDHDSAGLEVPMDDLADVDIFF